MIVFVLAAAAFFLGLGVGSFLNVAIDRTARNESLSGRSYCEKCGKTLGLAELIPVLSFAVQKGRCRNCGTALSWQYPLVETGTAVLFSLSFLLFDFSENASLIKTAGEVAAVLAVISALVVIFVSDVKYRIIPDAASLLIAVIGLAASFSRGNLFYDFIAALLAAAFLAAMWFFSKGKWMGLGDAKLSLALFLLIGYKASVSAFLLSFWLGAAAGAIMMALGAKTMKDKIAFGPYIIAAGAVSSFFSPQILSFLGIAEFI